MEPGKYLKIMLMLFIIYLLWNPYSSLAQELIIQGTAPNAKQNMPYHFQPEILNAEGEISFIKQNLPEWAEFVYSTGGLYSKNGPLNEHVGIYENIIIGVIETSTGRTAALGPFSIVVENVNDLPVLTDLEENDILSLPFAKENVQYNFDFLAHDEDLKINVGETVSFELLNAPSWLSVIQESSDYTNGIVKAQISGTPGDNDAGSRYFIQIIALDNQGERDVAGPFEIYVENTNDSPVISGIPSESVKQGGQYSFIPDYSDKDLNLIESFGDEIKFSIAFGIDGTDEQPEWLNFNPETGELSSKTLPSNDDVGIIKNIVISISDSLDANGNPDSSIDNSLAEFDLCILNINDAPVLSYEGQMLSIDQLQEPASAPQGSVYKLKLSSDDIDLSLAGRECVTIEDNIDFSSYKIYNMPDWAEFIEDTENPHGAVLVNKENRPNNNDVGPYPDIEIIVFDGQGGIDRLKFSLTVKNVNDTPCFTQIPQKEIIVDEDKNVSFIPLISQPDDTLCTNETIIEGTGKTSFIKANDIDIKYGDQLYFSLGGDDVSDWLEINAVSSTEAQLAGVPQNNDVGQYNIEIIVSDRENEDDPERQFYVYELSLTVNNVNDPPVFTKVPPNDKPIEINAKTPWTPQPDLYGTVYAEDIDKDDIVTYRLITSPAPGWMSVDSTGKLSGTPTNGDAGIHQIDVIADDNNGGTAKWTFYVKVNYVNTDPEFTQEIVNELSNPIIIDEDEYLNKTIFVNDNDIFYGDVLTYTIENAPSWLSVSKDFYQNAVLSGTPLVDDIGETNNIKLTVTDKEGISDSLTFHIQVIEKNDTPIISGSLPVGIVGRKYYFKPVVYDEENDKLCFRLETESTWLTIDESTGILTGLPLKRNLGENIVSIFVYEGDENCQNIQGREVQLGPVKLNVIGLEVIVLPGDIDANQTIDLKDSILALQILANVSLNESISKDAGLNGSRIIGMKEVIYILRKVAGN